MEFGPIELVVGAAGVALLGAAVLNRSPLGVLRSTAQGGSPSDAAPIDSGIRPASAGGLSEAATGVDTAAGAGSPTSASGMVSYRNPANALAGVYAGKSYQVSPRALTGLRRWAQALGVPGIIITIGYRSPQVQAERHAADPTRFAPPGSSWHERGDAVDVHLDAMRRAYGKTTAQVQAAGRIAGWCFAGKSGPMHASIGGCG